MSETALAEKVEGDAAETAAATTTETQKTAQTTEGQTQQATGTKTPVKETVVTTTTEAAAVEQKPAWPENWRAQIAGTDDKRNPLRKELDRYNDPGAIFHSLRELRRWRDEGGIVKLPGDKAPVEEVAAFHKALGVPEKPEGYLDHVKLDNGAVMGDADKPIVDYFAAAAHKFGMQPAAFNGIVNAYYAREEEQANQIDEMDETFRVETERSLRDEYGPTFTRYRNAIGTLFETMPGGSSAEGSFFANLAGGRTADGRIIGNHPDFIKWAVGLVRELKPLAAVTEDGNQLGQNVDDEISKIDKFMRTNRDEYFKDEKMQARYRELTAARERNRARSAA